MHTSSNLIKKNVKHFKKEDLLLVYYSYFTQTWMRLKILP